MNLIKSKRARLITAQAVVVTGLCIGLYFVFLKPDSSSPLNGAGVPGGPRVIAGNHPHRGQRSHQPGHGRRHEPRRGQRNRTQGGAPAGSVTQMAAIAGPGSWPEAPGGEPPNGHTSGGGPPSGGLGPPFGPGESQYASTTATLDAKLALSKPGP